MALSSLWQVRNFDSVGKYKSRIFFSTRASGLLHPSGQNEAQLVQNDQSDQKRDAGLDGRGFRILPLETPE